MRRRRSHARLSDIVEAATKVFIAQGYRRTQMGDVAEAARVAKGTIYLYVESKEALFDLVLRQASSPTPIGTPERLPVPTPKRGATLRFIRERLAETSLVADIVAMAARPARGTRAEIERVLGSIYDVLAVNRTGIKLVDRCAADHPELADLWFHGAREGLLGALGGYLSARGRLRRCGDPDVAARLILETLVYWAVHRHWDPSPRAFAAPLVKETVIRFLMSAIAGDREAR